MSRWAPTPTTIRRAVATMTALRPMGHLRTTSTAARCACSKRRRSGRIKSPRSRAFLSIRPRRGNSSSSIAPAEATAKGECNASLRGPPYNDLTLAVTYPPSYPDLPPIFGIVCGRNGNEEKNKRSSRSCLHDVQKRALLAAVTTAARAEDGTPFVYGFIHPAC